MWGDAVQIQLREWNKSQFQVALMYLYQLVRTTKDLVRYSHRGKKLSAFQNKGGTTRICTFAEAIIKKWEELL